MLKRGDVLERGEVCWREGRCAKEVCWREERCAGERGGVLKRGGVLERGGVV